MTNITVLLAVSGLLGLTALSVVSTTYNAMYPTPVDAKLSSPKSEYAINGLSMDDPVPSGAITSVRRDTSGLIITVSPQSAPNIFAQACKPTATPGYECYVSPDAKLIVVSPAPVPESRAIPAQNLAANPQSFTNQTYTFTFSQNQIVAAVQSN